MNQTECRNLADRSPFNSLVKLRLATIIGKLEGGYAEIELRGERIPDSLYSTLDEAAALLIDLQKMVGGRR